MDDINYDALIALLPHEYRAAVLAALQLAGALLAALSVLVPFIEKVVRATPSKSDDAYFEKLQRVRSMLSLFPRVVIPRLSQAPTRPAPAPEQAPHERPEAPTAKLEVKWPSAARVLNANEPRFPRAPRVPRDAQNEPE